MRDCQQPGCGVCEKMRSEREGAPSEADALRLELVAVTADRDRWVARMRELEGRLESIRSAVK